MVKSKTERQEECIEKWRNNKGLGTINAVVRFGKTRIAKLIIDKFKEQHPKTFVLILVPNDITRKNILSNIECSEERNVLCLTLNQFVNYCKENIFSCDLLVIDEIHRFLNNEAWYYLQQTKFKFGLGLSGTLRDEDKLKLTKINLPIVDIINEQEAIKNNYISHFVEYNIGVDLTNKEKEEYSKYTELITESLLLIRGVYKRINTLLKIECFKSDFDLMLSCFLGKKYTDYKNSKTTFYKPTEIRELVAYIQGWTKDIDLSLEANKNINKYYNPSNLYERAKIFKDFIYKRNEILVYNKNKLQLTLDIINKYKVRTIIFNESIMMVDELANLLKSSAIAYHSAIKSKAMINPATNDYFRAKNGKIKVMGKDSLKKMAIEGLKLGYYTELIAAKSLNEGLNIENIERVITTGGTINPITHEQRVGRGKTIDYSNPNKLCIIINIYIDDFMLNDKLVLSRDKQKLVNRQINSNNVIWISKIEEINSNYC